MVARGGLHHPLSEDHDEHPPEHCIDENELRDEFEEEVNPLRLLDVIESFQEYSKCHLNNSDDHS